jgi:formate C-acetyltransferase
LVFSNGVDKGEQISIQTGAVENMTTFEDFYHAYKEQMKYNIGLLVNADNAIDVAHAERCPLPFLSCMIDDCIGRGKTVQEGGAIYNFTGPQGFGVANMADALYVIKKLVYEEQKISIAETWFLNAEIQTVRTEEIKVVLSGIFKIRHHGI